MIPTFFAWVDGLGAWGPVAFIAGYALAAVAFVPGSLLTLAAGAIFGLGKGTRSSWSPPPWAHRCVSRRPVRRARTRSSAGWPATRASPQSTARSASEGRKIVLLLRLSPVFPFNLLNYALGLTQRALRRLPGGLGRDAAGHAALRLLRQGGGDVARLAGGAAAPRGPAYYAVLALGLLATVAVTCS